MNVVKQVHFSETVHTSYSIIGKSVLLLTQSEVDKTGASYYGKTQLHYADGSGDTAMVQLGKEGPIYSGKNVSYLFFIKKINQKYRAHLYL